MPKRTGEDRRKSSPKKNAPLAPLDDEAPAETNLDKTLLNMPAAQQERPSHMPPPGQPGRRNGKRTRVRAPSSSRARKTGIFCSVLRQAPSG